VFGIDVGGSQTHVLLLGSLSWIVATLFFSRAYRLTGVRIELFVPHRVSVGDELWLDIRLCNDGAQAHHRIRIEPPLLPYDGHFSRAVAEIEELLPRGRASALASVRFSARGEHELEAFRAVALLPLGLSQGPAVRTPGARFMVVPRLAKVVSFATPHQRRQQPGGVSRASRTGDATELLGLRPYRRGDPLRDLSARAWARHGQPMVREYQERHFTRFGVVVDTDVSAASPAHLEGALSLGAGIVARLCAGEALVEVLVTGQRVEPLSLHPGRSTLDQALDLLAVASAESEFAGARLLGRLVPQLSRLSSLVFVALGWDEARAAFISTIEARGVRCVVFVVGDSAARSARFTSVSLDAISSGQEIAL
jgi:uncharacterized protein (DUF58 family)